MNLFKYRKFVVNTNIWERELLVVNDWRLTDFSIFMSMSVIEYRRFKYLNNSLVKSGKAFWLNHNTLCLGYKLIYLDNYIFKPIFNNDRQKLIDEFQNNIPKVVLKREEKCAYIELLKIRKFPSDIVNKIIKIAYFNKNKI